MAIDDALKHMTLEDEIRLVEEARKRNPLEWRLERIHPLLAHRTLKPTQDDCAQRRLIE